ncbi:hypothetical protein O9993_17090 [Vibrio lentus]|nr:hypothetical protein [Vibrio lentus]
MFIEIQAPGSSAGIKAAKMEVLTLVSLRDLKEEEKTADRKNVIARDENAAVAELK